MTEKQTSQKTPYPIHPDFEGLARIPVPTRRLQVRLMQRICSRLPIREAPREDFALQKVFVRLSCAPQGKIPVLIYSNTQIQPEEAAPCLLWIHGGAFLFPPLPYHYRFARKAAENLRCRVIMPLYDLAPDYVPPLQQEEVYELYLKIRREGSRFGVDPERILVAGDSAGGTLAAALCLMARDRGEPVPRAQALFYPSLDATLGSESMKNYPDVPVCNGDSIRVYYDLCRGEEYDGNNDYRSPLEAASLAGMPDAYIETAEFDALHDDGVAYARRLREEGCFVELNETEGTVHAFEIAEDSDITKAAHQRRLDFMAMYF